MHCEDSKKLSNWILNVSHLSTEDKSHLHLSSSLLFFTKLSNDDTDTQMNENFFLHNLSLSLLLWMMKWKIRFETRFFLSHLFVNYLFFYSKQLKYFYFFKWTTNWCFLTLQSKNFIFTEITSCTAVWWIILLYLSFISANLASF